MNEYTLCSRCNEKPAAICLSCLTDCTLKQPLREQPCGCILCICDTEDRCLGCGAKMCEKHKAIGHLPNEDMVYEQQPPTGEFTKDIRLVLKEMSDDGKFHRKIMEKACDRLDSAEAINKELLEALERLLLYSDCSPHCSDRKEAEKFARDIVAKSKKEGER